MSSTTNDQSTVVNLRQLLDDCASASLKAAGNGVDGKRKQPEGKLFPAFPLVLSLVRSRLDPRSRALLENCKPLQLSSSAKPAPPSHLYDSGAILHILNVQHSRNNNIRRNPSFVVESVGYVDLLFGEELYRRSRDGCLAPTGRKLEIPKHFRGWFEVLSQDGRSSPQLTEVASLVKKEVRHFLLTRPTKVLLRAASDSPDAAGPYRPAVLGAGHALRWTRVSTLGDRRYLTCLLDDDDDDEKHEGSQPKDVDEVLLPLQGQGRFLPLARGSSLTDAHDASFLMTHIYMPVVVCMYWPPGARNIPQLTLPGKPDKSAEVKRMKFFQKRSSSSPRMEQTTKSSSGSSSEYLSSALVRIHGHARQGVLYAAAEQKDATGAATDFTAVVALRAQACGLFDVALMTRTKVEDDVLGRLRIKRDFVQSCFEKEVKIYDTTLYKMTGEKLTVAKQPMTFLDESESVTFRQRRRDISSRTRQEEEEEEEEEGGGGEGGEGGGGGISNTKRRSLPLDVLEEAMFTRGDRTTANLNACTRFEDDESLLMNEIENIYMRVRYWDRSVRYPMPQKSKPTPPRRTDQSRPEDEQRPVAITERQQKKENDVHKVQKEENLPEMAPMMRDNQKYDAARRLQTAPSGSPQLGPPPSLPPPPPPQQQQQRPLPKPQQQPPPPPTVQPQAGFKEETPTFKEVSKVKEKEWRSEMAGVSSNKDIKISIKKLKNLVRNNNNNGRRPMEVARPATDEFSFIQMQLK